MSSPAEGAGNTLRFYFDPISHNAWLAWSQLPALCEQFDLQLEPVPVLFAGLLKHHGQVGPAEVAPKRQWMLFNVLRKARQHGIDIAPPYSHPFNPLAALRAITACQGSDRIRATERLFRATWAESRPVHEADCVAEELRRADLDAGAIMAAAASDTVKAELRASTEQALRDGVFGVPSMQVRGELFFGFDDLPYLRAFLEGRDPLNTHAEELAAWSRIQPTAERRRG